MRPACRWQLILLILLISAAFLWIYARPHDDIIAGQDGPSYLHCASEYARHGHLTYSDEMLSKVAPESRSQFLYRGHKSSYLTKFGSLLMPDIKYDKLQTWFQVAPSLLLSLPAKCFGNRSILYIMPLFGILNGLAMAVLAMAVFGKSRAVGWSAALLYWMNPMIIWHARALRAEFAASFILWSGVALLFSAMRQRKPWWIWLLASTAVNMAPFFHITSTMVVIPVAMTVAWFVAKGNRIGLIFGAVQSAMVALFALQTIGFTDPYGLLRYFKAVPFGQNWWMTGIVAVIGWCAVATIGTLASKHLPNLEQRLQSSRWLRISVTLTVSAIILAILLHVMHWTPATELKSLVYHYYYRTDLRSVARLFSLPVALCGLFGLIMLLLGGGKGTARRYLFCLVAMPAALGIGNMYDFFTTRYLIVAMIPLLTLSLVSLVQWIGEMKIPIPYRTTLVLVIILGLLLHGRLLLVKHVDRAGLYEHLEEVADVINSDNAILLCEYSRVAGAMEHLFGIPTLGLDGKNVEPYNTAEKSWREIMEKSPQRSAYYMTPFDSHPRSTQMNFEFVRKFKLNSSVLVDRRWDLPVATKPWGMTLYLYKINLNDNSVADAKISMSPSNMGFSRFSGCRNKAGVSVSGVNIPKNNPLALMPCAIENMQNAELWLLLHSTQKKCNVERLPPCPHCAGSKSKLNNRDSGISAAISHTHRQKPQPLGNNWFLLRIPALHMNTGATLWTEADTIVSQAFYVDGSRVVEADDILSKYPQTQLQADYFVARWARQDASITLSRSGENGAVLLMFMTPPSEVGDSVVVTTTFNGESTTKNMPTGSWRWSAIPIEAGSDSREIKFSTTHPFDPHVSGFDKDLSLFMGYGHFINQ